MQHDVQAVILAAGKSTRFGTGQSKQLVELCGMPMMVHALELLHSLSIDTTAVLGYQADEIEQSFKEYKAGKKVTVVHQAEQKGTGDAVRCSEPAWHADHILILNGDMPLLTQEVISSLIYRHKTGNYALTFATMQLDNPTGYGRVFADKTGSLLICEEKECTPEQRSIKTVNAGVYLVRRDFLAQSLQTLLESDVTGEVYITDIIADAGNRGKKVGTYEVVADLVRGVNTLAELAAAEHILYERIRRRWLAHGVRLVDPSSILIDRGVRIGRGSMIERGAQLRGTTTLGKRVRVEPYAIVTNTTIADEGHIKSHSVLQDSVVGCGVQVGPFAHLRGKATLEDGAVIGNFVEIKNSTIGSKAKAKHLSYIGDATVGERANIGAGSITCNYDGQRKHHTRIGARAMIGANSSLVAPLSVGAQAYIAAGSVITRDVPGGALGVGRTRQENKEQWVAARRVLGEEQGR